MKKIICIAGIAGLGLGFLVRPASGQSLGEIARQLREKRAKETKPVKVYTNADVERLSPKIDQTAPAAETAETPSPAETESAPAAEKAPAPAPAKEKEDKMKTRDYWQAKFKAARADLATAQEEQQLSENELSLLQTRKLQEISVTAQQQIDQDLTAKQAQVDQDRAATAKAQKALDDLEQEFKDSGAPEDWSKTD